MAVAYKSAGAGVSTEASGGALSPLCPATVDAGDVLIAHVFWEGTTTAPSEPAGWTNLTPTPYVIETTIARHWVFGKIADGTEDGAAVAFGAPAVTTQRAARIYSYSGRVSGTIAQIVNGFVHQSHATDPQMPTVTTTKTGALAVALVAQNDNNTSTSATGETGGDWTEAVAEYVAALTPGLQLQMQTCVPTGDPGTVTGGTVATTNDPCGVIGFQIMPSEDVPALECADIWPAPRPRASPTFVFTPHDDAAFTAAPVVVVEDSAPLARPQVALRHLAAQLAAAGDEVVATGGGAAGPQDFTCEIDTNNPSGISTSGSNITSLNDLSGNGRHFTQADSDDQATTVTDGGKTVGEFTFAFEVQKFYDSASASFFGSNWTACARVKPTNTPSTTQVAGINQTNAFWASTDGGHKQGGFWTNTGQPQATTGAWNGSFTEFRTSQNVSVGTWYDVMVRKIGNDLVLTVKPVGGASAETSVTITGTMQNANPHAIRIGGATPGANQFFNGRFQRLRTYDYDLTDAELAAVSDEWDGLAASAPVDEDHAPPARPWRLDRAPLPSFTDDDLPVVVATVVEDEAFQPARPWATQRSLPTAADDEPPAGALFGVPHEDHPAALTLPPRHAPTATAPAAIPVWLSDVQEPAGSLYGVPHDEPWPAELGPRPRPLVVFQPLPLKPDPEELPAGALYGVPEEDAFQPRPPQPAQLLRAAPAVPDDDLPVVVVVTVVDEEAGPVVGRWRTLAHVRVDLVDDPLPPQPAVTFVDDDVGLVPRRRPDDLVNARLVFHDDELVKVTVDDDAVVPARRWPTQYRVVAQVDGEDLIAVVVDDDPGSAPSRPWPAERRRSYLVASEDVVAAVVDDDAGLAPARPWVQELVRAALAQDETFAAEPVVFEEDGYAPPLPWPVPAPVVPKIEDGEPAGSLQTPVTVGETIRAPRRRLVVVALPEVSVRVARARRAPSPSEPVRIVRPRRPTRVVVATEEAVPLSFSPKDPAEDAPLGINFVDVLDTGETVSAASTSFSFVRGDASAAAPVAVGAADISGDPVVMQRVSGGGAGATWRMEIQVTTSAGRTLVQSALLPIVDGGA